MRLFGSFAVLADVNFFFIPDIRAQNDFFLAPPSGCGAFRPGFPGFAALYEARPLAFKPPFSDLPSLRCHAGVLAIEHRRSRSCWSRNVHIRSAQYAFTGEQHVDAFRNRRGCV